MDVWSRHRSRRWVTYHAEVHEWQPRRKAGIRSSRSIVLHMQSFETDPCGGPRECIRVYRLLRGSDSVAEDKWKRCGPGDDFGTARGIFECPKQPVYVGDQYGAPCSDRFASLLPCEY